MKYKFSDIVEFVDKPCGEFDGERKYVSTGSLHGSVIADAEVKKVYYDDRPSRANLEVEKGDILFAKMQSTRKTLLIDDDLSNNIYSTGFCAVKPKKDIISEKCLFYLVDNKIFLRQKDRNCSGATQKAINKQGLSLIQLSIPTLDEQKKIDKVLDIVSGAIQNRQQQMKKLDDLVKARFVEMFSGKYPIIILGDKFQTMSGGTPSKKHPEYYERGTIPWLTSGEINQGIIKKVKNMITEEGVRNSSAKLIPKNSILIAMYGATAGQVGLLKTPTTTNQAVYAILPNGSYLPEYLYYAISMNKSWVIQQCVGGAQPNISQTIIRRMRITDAPLRAQKTFAGFVHQVDKSKFVIQKSLKKTQMLFDSLMQEYFG